MTHGKQSQHCTVTTGLTDWLTRIDPVISRHETVDYLWVTRPMSSVMCTAGVLSRDCLSGCCNSRSSSLRPTELLINKQNVTIINITEWIYFSACGVLHGSSFHSAVQHGCFWALKFHQVMWWRIWGVVKIQMLFCRKFTEDSNGEKILKIGQHFTMSEPKNIVALFSGHSVYLLTKLMIRNIVVIVYIRYI